MRPAGAPMHTAYEVPQIKLACAEWETALAVTEQFKKAGSTLVTKAGPDERIPLGRCSCQAALPSAVATSANTGTLPLLNLDIEQTEPLVPMPAEASVSLTVQSVASDEPTKLPITIGGAALTTTDPQVMPLLWRDKTPLSDDLPSTSVEEPWCFFIGEAESFFIGEASTPQSAASSFFIGEASTPQSAASSFFVGEADSPRSISSSLLVEEADSLQSTTPMESAEVMQMDCQIATAARAVKAAWAEHLRSLVQVFSAVLHFQAVLGTGATHAVLATTRAASGALTACMWKAAQMAWGAASKAACASMVTYVQAARELALRAAQAVESIHEHAVQVAQTASMRAVHVIKEVQGGVSGAVHFSPVALSGGCHRFFRSVFVGDVQLADAEVELVECLVTGSMSLGGSSRLAVSSSLLTGAVALEGSSALVICSGLLTGQVSCSAVSMLKNHGGIILSAVKYPAP